jgi:dihydroorotase-like cyclic amidohydrolase
MSVQFRVAGGQVLLPGGAVEADLLVDNEKVVGVVDRNTEVADVGSVVDATGKVVLPGMVDVHVHTREPGHTHKDDIYTTTLQAAAGGVTTIFGMPNLTPPTNSVETLQQVFDLYAEKSIVDYNHNPAATLADQLVPMAAMGINAYKIYMVVDTGRTYPHPAGTGMHGHGDLLKMMDIIAGTGKRFIIHPHDQSLMDYIEGEYRAR